MKFNKKLLTMLLVVVMMLSMVACSDNNENAAGSMDITNETPESNAGGSSNDEGTSNEVTLEDAVNGFFADLPENMYKIKQTDFVQKVIDGEEMFVLDIRTAEDYAKGHITGAVNAPWGTAISDNLKNIPTDVPVYIYCYSGQTAGQAVHTLNVAGINARSVNLGWNFGISKVEGVEALTTTEATEFTVLDNDVDASIQAAMDAYYAGLADVKGTMFGNYKVSEANLQELLASGDDGIYLLSIRSQADYDKAHIAGAELMSYGKGMEQEFASLPKDKTIVVYCYSGQTAGQTVAGLRLLGYDAVSLNGGMGVGSNAPIGWTNKGFTVVTPVTSAVNTYFAEIPENMYKIKQDEFVQKVQDGEEMFIVDIRSAEDYAKGHIVGAVNAPWGTAISDNLLNMPMDVPVYIYCYSGQTAGQAVHTLNVAGISARSVNLGWNFGISKVDGVSEITSTEATEFVALGNDIDVTIQAAMDVYYAGLADVKSTVFKNYKVSEATLEELIASEDDSIYLLSIRAQKDYDQAHIAGAERMSFGKGMEQEFASLPKDKTIVVYCYSGQTAGQTVAALRLLGYDAVSLNGGMGVGSNAPLGWTNKGFDTVQ